MVLTIGTPTSEEAAELGGDIMHDPWLTCDGRQLAVIAAEVFDQCEALRPSVSRRPRRDAVVRRHRVSNNIVANLAALVLRHPTSRGVAISARNDAITRYDRRDFPREVVSHTLTMLEHLGLIHRQEGSWHGIRTSIQPSYSLRSRIASEVDAVDVGRSADGETIILRASSGQRGQLKPLIDYAETDETCLLRSEISRINDALNGVSIAVDGIPCGPIHLTRRFQIASSEAPRTFDQHGRIYDGFWINMHRTERHRIRINGEALADLDFTAMFTQLAYLEAGLPLPEGDPYAGFPGLDIVGDDPELAHARRDAIKRGLNAFFFRTGRMERLPSEIKRLLGPEWTATKFAAAARTRHAPIKHLFGTGLGIRLMFTESRILVKTLLDLLDLGIIALPIHDGIMVPASRQQEALQVMRNASASITGFELPVKAKLLDPH